MANWLVAGGEIGERIRAFDWSSTPLGPLDSWPQSLRTAVNFMLEARQPVYVGWGAESISLYNSGYIPILADKHPAAIGKPYAAIWPEIWDEYRPHVEAVMAGHAQYWVDQPVMLVDRPERPVSWFTFSWTPLRDEQGAVGGFICVATETTERILAERQLVESMDEGYCVIEMVYGADGRATDYRLLKSNPAFEQQTGLRDAEGKTVKELVPEFEQQWIDIYAQVALTGQSTRFINESPALGRWFDVYAFRIIGTADQVGVLFRDITDRKQFELRLQDADRRKDEFLAMLAHELRNPLAPVAAAADLLQLGRLDESRMRHATGVISRQVRHMTALVDDLLDVSRVTRGMVRLERQPVDIEHAVHDAVEQVRPLVQGRRHRLQLDLAPHKMTVFGDRKRLVQVLANLLNNAAKYTPEGGTIRLITGMREGAVYIDVIDDGSGMEPELVTRVFDLFSQAERTSDRTSGGLGLGLALVKSIVELHDGSVRCASAGIGKGSRFTICLPVLASEDAAAEHPGDASHSPLAARPLRIMVVDDNVDAASMLAIILQSMGHRVDTQHDARHALERAAAEPPDVFLLDIGLPGLDGYDLARRLRAMPQLANARLVAITGYGREQDVGNALAAGFDYHFIKPVDSGKLVELLNEIGGHRVG